jgi:L-threonylcarbamoyladenylate synthase
MEPKNIEILKKGGMGVIPTDTIYGLVGSALSLEAVNRISKIKNRTNGKGFIVLVSSINDLLTFGVDLTETTKVLLQKFWPGKVSVEFYCGRDEFNYLKKEGGTIAFRFPDKSDLLQLLKEVGPLVAPSANPESLSPAKNIIEAKEYFGNKVDFYEDGGELDSAPSTLVRIVGDKVEILRQGIVKIN